MYVFNPQSAQVSILCSRSVHAVIQKIVDCFLSNLLITRFYTLSERADAQKVRDIGLSCKHAASETFRHHIV